MFIDVIFVRMMQVAVVKVVDVVTVTNSRVAATGPMNMCMIGVFGIVAGHEPSPSFSVVREASSAAWSRTSRKRRTT